MLISNEYRILSEETIDGYKVVIGNIKGCKSSFYVTVSNYKYEDSEYRLPSKKAARERALEMIEDNEQF
jgi:putative component of membrane protein insertase Oxa1/YidC/SpoIIIJ protein YidD